jgi:hypothetical protein
MTDKREVTNDDFFNEIEKSGKKIIFNAPDQLKPKGSIQIMLMDRLATLNHMLEVQGEDGKWDNDEMSCGVYNGLEYATAIMENREPKFRTVLIDTDNDVPIRFLKNENE